MRKWMFRFFVLATVGCAFAAIRARSGGNVVPQFNKHILNPFALWVLGRRPMYYGVMHHVGRHSGREYATPVVAKITPVGIIVPLPYGAHTDWCRNICAARRGRLTFQGSDYSLEHPVIVDASFVAPLVPPATARVWRWLGIKQYLRLDMAEAAREPIPRAA